jgi:MOSC domain-containing protein YiiM
MNSVYVEGVYIGKAKNPGHGLVIDIDKQRLERRTWLWPQGLSCDEHGDPRLRTGQVEDWTDCLPWLPLEGLRA